MKKITLLLTLAATFIGSASFAQAKIEFEEFTLDNGLHVILHQDNSTPIVAVSVLYHVGSKDENPERTGFAHFFEHLLFEGSENIGRGEFSEYVEKAGGVLNANTSNDRTFYYDLLPSNQLELGLWLESERMLHAKVDEKGIETQREVVKEEKRQRVDNQPYGTLLEEVMKRAYTKHPYQWQVIGSMEHLDAATEEDYVGFYETYYVPNNATLSIAGDIDIKETKKMVEMYFGDIPRGKDIPRVDIVEPDMTEEVRDTVYDNIQLPAVVHAFRIPAQGTDDFYAVSLLNTLLSQGESSRLNKSVVDDKELAIQVMAFPFPLEHPGVNLVFGLANMGKDPGEMEKAMDAEYKRAREELITEEELEKLKNQLESNMIMRNSTMAQIAESLANYHTYFGDANLINTEIERYRKVTREDIKRVANKYFHENNRVALYFLPESN